MQVGMIKPIDKKITFGSSEEPSNSQKIEDKVDEFTRGADAVTDGMEKASDTCKRATEKASVLGVTAAGLWATIKKPFVGIKEWLKDFEMTEVVKDGKKILEKAKDEEGNFIKADTFGKTTAGKAKIAFLAGLAIVGLSAFVISKISKAAKAKKAKAEEEKAKVQEKKQNEEVEIARAEAEKARAEAEKAKAEAEKAKADTTKADTAHTEFEEDEEE